MTIRVYEPGMIVECIPDPRRAKLMKTMGQGVLVERLPDRDNAQRVWRVYYPKLKRVVRVETSDIRASKKITLTQREIDEAKNFAVSPWLKQRNQFVFRRFT